MRLSATQLSAIRYGRGGIARLPLDAATTWLAVSVSRRLYTTYTGPLIRLRRDSDNAESNFSYNALNQLDTAAIATWLGAATGFVVTLYDQSGNGRNYRQPSASLQPQFVASSGINSKPAASFNGTSHAIPDDSVAEDTTLRDWMGIAAMRPAVTTGGTDVVFSSRPFNAEDWAMCSLTNVNNLGYAQGGGMANYYPTTAGAVPGTPDAQVAAWIMASPSSGRIRRNGVDLATGLTSSTRRFAANTIFGQEQSGGAYYNGLLSEFVLAAGANFSDLTAYETSATQFFASNPVGDGTQWDFQFAENSGHILTY